MCVSFSMSLNCNHYQEYFFLLQQQSQNSLCMLSFYYRPGKFVIRSCKEKNYVESCNVVNRKAILMSEKSEILQGFNDECVQTIKTASDKVDSFMKPYVEKFQNNILNNIPQEFGNFLYAALGDKITGQRNFVVNNKYFAENYNGKKISERAHLAGTSVIKYIKNSYWNDKIMTFEARSRRYKEIDIQAYLTAGRKFGISYFANSRRIHTMYFGAGQCFRFLRPEHVQCVKNKLKRECAHDFLNFRDEVLNGIEKLSSEIIEVNVPIKLAQVFRVSKTNKLSQYDGYSAPSNYILMEGIVDSMITHVISVIPKYDVWNGYDTVYSGELKKDEVEHPSFISLIFMNINKNENAYKIIANVDIDINNMNNTLQKAHLYNESEIMNIVEGHEKIRSNYKYKKSIISETEYDNYTLKSTEGIILNLDEVLKNPTVTDFLEKRIQFFNNISENLQQLKYKHSTLYFINGDA